MTDAQRAFEADVVGIISALTGDDRADALSHLADVRYSLMAELMDAQRDLQAIDPVGQVEYASADPAAFVSAVTAGGAIARINQAQAGITSVENILDAVAPGWAWDGGELPF